MRFLRLSLTGLFLLSVTLGLLVYAGSLVSSAINTWLTDEPSMPRARERVFAVKVEEATPREVTPVLTVFGEVQSRRTLEIRAAAGGTIIGLADSFEEGGTVSEGQVLARVDPADADAALSRAGADLADAQANRRDAARAVEIARDTLTAAEDQAGLRDRAFRRQQDLRDRGVGTEAAVETAELAAASARQAVLAARNALAAAETRVDQAETTLTRARLARDEARRRVDDMVIRAKFDGTLSGVAVVEGRRVSANEKLADLVDGAALEVAFRVSTPQYSRLIDRDGTLRPADVEVTLDVLGASLTTTGTISRDGAAVGEGQTGRLLLARLDAARGLKPGDFVTIRVREEPLAGVVRLPASALDAEGTVLVIGADSRLETLPVTLVRRQGDDVLVRGPAVHGRSVVTQRSPLLGDGIRVKPLGPRPETAQTPAAPAMVELSAERRARLVAFVQENKRLPDAMRTRILAQLEQPSVPAQVVERLESRMGG
ncbi:efflux RND transporter periplasmic adaptor subunit [Pseudooceanicola aestuarii]|uniref:efflux RND transporter periplasmic adaptor subunit n=1 Tax=Pseudooceanicola aestuarii TaxID=2697319 RepID=UPI0013D2F44C|nr:HlyD family efflux transporter periplasmic adaptor subunit [Pseudooceanicola aestuarii]